MSNSFAYVPTGQFAECDFPAFSGMPPCEFILDYGLPKQVCHRNRRNLLADQIGSLQLSDRKRLCHGDAPHTGGLCGLNSIDGVLDYHTDLRR